MQNCAEKKSRVYTRQYEHIISLVDMKNIMGVICDKDLISEA